MSESDDVQYPYLWPRPGGRYSVRMRVPTDLRHLDKREHVVVALGTSDRREALSRYKQVVGTIERGFEQMRLQAVSEDRVAAALKKGRLDLLDSADVEGLARHWFDGRRSLAKAAVGTGDVSAQDERNDLAIELSDPEASAETVQRAADRLLLEPRGIRVAEFVAGWGSCGPSGTIHLDWRLVFAPKRVLEYVVVHELAHLQQRSHGEDFWRLLATILPDYERGKAWLDANQGSLDAAFLSGVY